MQDTDTVQKIAVFDFCETLADFQTANAFVDFVRHNTKSFGIRSRNLICVLLFKSQVVKILNTITSHKYSIGKLIKLWQLKGLSHDKVDELANRFYKERVEPHLIDATINRLRLLKKDGYKVGLSSGGYDVYLKYFANDYELDFVQCSVIAFKNGLCTGRIDGVDCMRKEKVNRLTCTFGEGTNAIAFSDSKSDLPMLQWASQGVVISRGGHQQWMEKYNLQEIIW